MGDLEGQIWSGIHQNPILHTKCELFMKKVCSNRKCHQILFLQHFLTLGWLKELYHRKVSPGGFTSNLTPLNATTTSHGHHHHHLSSKKLMGAIKPILQVVTSDLDTRITFCTVGCSLWSPSVNLLHGPMGGNALRSGVTRA